MVFRNQVICGCLRLFAAICSLALNARGGGSVMPAAIEGVLKSSKILSVRFAFGASKIAGAGEI
jgi:hypothetical protein